jgi:hypothetical protein
MGATILQACQWVVKILRGRCRPANTAVSVSPLQRGVHSARPHAEPMHGAQDPSAPRFGTSVAIIGVLVSP